MWLSSVCRIPRAPRVARLHHQLGRRVHTQTAGVVPSAPQPRFSQLVKHGFAAAVPMIGFGFMDQLVMITVGDHIDANLGATLGIHTLTAAALGQVVSDTSGVLFGQVIENIGQKVGLPSSKLTAEQMKLPRVLGVRTAGMALGVASGCFLGMISLYFLDLDKRAKEEKIQGLEPLMKSMVDSCHQLIGAEHCHLWLVDPTDPEYIWSRAMTTAPPSTENLQKAFGYIAGSSEGVTAHKLMTAVFAIGRETNAENVEKQLIRIEKDLELQSNSVRSDLNQDRTFAFEVFAEYMRQEVTAGLEIHTRVRPGGFKHTAIQTKKTVLRDPVVRDPLFNKMHNLVTGLRTRNVLVSPIISLKTGQVLGLIEMANKFDDSFSQGDVRTVELMAKHTALFLEK
eukprot:m.245524 g.245524  ORF g.245524 m.245524 type:complete len:397 (+) comp26406_c1_seq1:191-1381(+)